MQSARLLFNGTLYRKNLARFWPIWGLYLFFWTVALVVPLALNAHPLLRAEEYIYDTMRGGGLLPAFLAAPVAVLAVFSYLYRAAPANQTHSLPIRREGLLLTNLLSALTFLWGPQVVVCGLTLLTLAVQGTLHSPRAALLWLLVQCLASFFFVAFAVFCGMFTGHWAALPVFYGVLNFLVPGLYELVGQMLRQFLYGFYAWGNAAVAWFWPLVRMINALRYSGGVLTGLWVLWVYAAVGLALLAAAVLVYRRRHLERAGDVVTVTALRPVFAFGVALCCAIVFGMALHDWLGLPSGTGLSLAGCMLLCGAIGYFAAHMLLEKSFRVLRRWRGCLAFSLALLLCCTVVELDLLGVEGRVPAAPESAALTGIYSLPRDTGSYIDIVATDEALMAEIIALHRAMIERRDDLAAARTTAETAAYTTKEPQQTAVPQPWDYTTTSLGLRYVLPGGGLLQRRYSIPVSPALLKDPDSPAARLTALLNRPEVRAFLYDDFGEGSPLPVSAYHYDGERRTDLSTEQTAALYRAVQSDLAAGRLGRRFLLEDEAYLETVCWDELVFSFAIAGDPRQTREVTITLQATATDTFALLSEPKAR